MFPKALIQFLFKDDKGTYANVSKIKNAIVLDLDCGVSYTPTLISSVNVATGDKVYYDENGAVASVVKSKLMKKSNNTTGNGCQAVKRLI